MKNILESLREIKKALRGTKLSIEELKESQKKTDEQMKETNKQIKTLTKAISELNEVWKNLREKVVMVSYSIEDALKELGFKIEYIIANVRESIDSESIDIEINILAGGGKEVIVVEVKTTLKVEDVENFIKKFRDKLSTCFPEFGESFAFASFEGKYKIYGAVAGLKLQKGVDKFAIKNGLWVFRYKDKGKFEVLNPKGFKPRVFLTVYYY